MSDYNIPEYNILWVGVLVRAKGECVLCADGELVGVRG